MLVVISPAKKLDMTHYDAVEASLPSFNSKTEELVTVMQALSSDDIGHLMGISANLADLNRERFTRFGTQEKKPAMYAFAGDTYQGLDAKTLADDDLVWAQDHLRILSGLYGLLRPLDDIEPYRLEMGSRLATDRGKNLYDFWGKNISKEIEKELKDMNSNLLINLASNEYYDSVQSLSDDVKVISPIFKDKGKDGKYKIISFYAKKARGYMASWLVKNKIKKEQELQSFSEEGYRFSIEESHSGSPVFLRD